MLSAMPLHEHELLVDEGTVRALLRAQRPDLAHLDVRFLGSGTDNTMFRVGDRLLARLPRTAGHVAPLQKELTWLPRLRGLLPVAIPVPVLAGTPDPAFPLPWALLERLDGEEASPGTIGDPARFGGDLAAVVAALRRLPLPGVDEEPQGWRGGPLQPLAEDVADDLRRLRDAEDGLDLDVLEARWRRAVALPAPSGPRVWLHGDLKPSNLLVLHGRLHAVIDFGGLCVGLPDAEHAPVWDLPPEARAAYRDALDLDDGTWQRAQGWAIAVGVTGLGYYRDTFPAFAEECRRRLRALAA